MRKKIISLIERNATEELKAYFDTLSSETPLDVHEELVLLEHFEPAAVKSYINRFRLSEQAETLFLDKAPSELRLAYFNYYSLSIPAQKHLVKHDMFAAAADFFKLRRFFDVSWLLKHAKAEIIRLYLSRNALEDEKEVITLLHHENQTLFASYVAKGNYISQKVKHTVIEEENVKAFSAIMYAFARKFKQKSKKKADFAKIMQNHLADLALPEEEQVEVLCSYNRELREILLKTSPLYPKAQEVLFKRNYDPEWLKLHVCTLYGRGGYRFTPENEKKLFCVLAAKNLDDCLTTFRHQDDITFVQCASPAAVTAYLKSFWLTDDAQVALITRGNAELIKTLISRYNPEHGLCWQAEVELVKLGAFELVRSYVS